MSITDETTEDQIRRYVESLSHVSKQLWALSPVQVEQLAPQIDALHEDMVFMLNHAILDVYDSCGKQDVHIGEC